jgi:hypothetical protein
VADRWRPHVAVPGLFAIAAGNILLVGAVYALATCFVLHLALRGYWVALVGVHSVFPGGARWEQAREYGPVQGQLSRDRLRPLPEHIARADNVASLVFATGFLLAASVLSGVVVLAILALPAWAAVSLWGVRGVIVVLALTAGPAFLAMVTAQALDYGLRGRDLDAYGGRVRFIRMVLGPLQRLTPAGIRSLGMVLVTNVSKRVVVGALLVGSVGSLAGAALTADGGGDLPGAGNYRFFDGAAPSALAADRYETLRGDAPASERAPTLDSDVITGPYARLFIPYRAMVHNDALARECPGLPELDGDDSRAPAARAAAASVLACAARVHRVALDGRVLENLRFRFLADPRTNLRGFAAYVPVRDLAPGEHLLTVWPARRSSATGPAAPYELPFWR